MKYMPLLCNPTYLILFMFCPFFVRAQLTPEVQNVSFKQAGKIIEIHYDLVNAQPDETFKVWVKAFRPDGTEIPMSSIIGAVGDNITGGENKTIFWNFDGDLIAQNSPLNFQVYASSNLALRRRKPFPVHVLKSAILPGWGQSSKGKPYWLIGIGTYGLLAGSIWQNRQAEQDYMDYLAELNREERNNLFLGAENKDRNSKIMAYAAGGIWLGNIIWASLKKKPALSNLSIYALPQQGGLGLTYKF